MNIQAPIHAKVVEMNVFKMTPSTASPISFEFGYDFHFRRWVKDEYSCPLDTI